VRFWFRLASPKGSTKFARQTPTDSICRRTRNSAHPRLTSKNGGEFDVNAFLATIGEGRKTILVPKKRTIFAKGEPSDAVLDLQTGKVRLHVVSKTGKEATIGIWSDESFFGEGSLARQPLLMSTLSAITDCAILRIEKKAMMDTLHREHALSDLFVAYLLTRNIRSEQDLVDQLSNSSEKRLARVLLMLAHFGKQGSHEPVIPRLSQEMLQETSDTTRSRMNFFTNRFRKWGLIDYAQG
jgi:CRP/FNR family cyclic AMP-dependent transcriptional regulator